MHFSKVQVSICHCPAALFCCMLHAGYSETSWIWQLIINFFPLVLKQIIWQCFGPWWHYTVYGEGWTCLPGNDCTPPLILSWESKTGNQIIFIMKEILQKNYRLSLPYKYLTNSDHIPSNFLLDKTVLHW